MKAADSELRALRALTEVSPDASTMKDLFHLEDLYKAIFREGGSKLDFAEYAIAKEKLVNKIWAFDKEKLVNKIPVFKHLTDFQRAALDSYEYNPKPAWQKEVERSLRAAKLWDSTKLDLSKNLHQTSLEIQENKTNIENESPPWWNLFALLASLFGYKSEALKSLEAKTAALELQYQKQLKEMHKAGVSFDPIASEMAYNLSQQPIPALSVLPHAPEVNNLEEEVVVHNDARMVHVEDLESGEEVVLVVEDDAENEEVAVDDTQLDDVDLEDEKEDPFANNRF